MSDLAALLAEALDLCARARKLDELWNINARYNSALDRDAGDTRCAFIPVFATDQYERDLAAWEQRARAALGGVIATRRPAPPPQEKKP